MRPTTVALGDLMPLKNVTVDPRKTPRQEFELFSIPAYDTGHSETVSGSDVGSSKQVVEEGDVLLSRIVPHIRRAWVVQSSLNRPLIGSGEWIIFRSERFDSSYLRHALVSDRFHQAFMQTVAGVGGSLLRARPALVADIEIPLPPIEEQRRIAAILDAADALRARRRETIAELDTLIRAIFVNMFGDAPTGFHVYESACIGDIATNQDSIRVPVKASDRREMFGKYPYYGASGVIDHVDDYLFDGQRLLVAEDGANLLARSTPIAFMADGRYWVNNHAHVLADNGIGNLFYLREALEILDLTPYVTGSAQPKLNRKRLDSIRVPLPSRSLQDEFENRVLAVRGLEVRWREHSTHLDTLFKSLQQHAFRGDL